MIVADVEIILVELDEDECEVTIHDHSDDQKGENFREKLYEGVVSNPHIPIMLIPKLQEV